MRACFIGKMMKKFVLDIGKNWTKIGSFVLEDRKVCDACPVYG